MEGWVGMSWMVVRWGVVCTGYIICIVCGAVGEGEGEVDVDLGNLGVEWITRMVGSDGGV